MKNLTIGIDFGTTNTVISYYKNQLFLKIQLKIIFLLKFILMKIFIVEIIFQLI